MCSEVLWHFIFGIVFVGNSKCYMLSLKILWNTFERRLMGPGHNSPLWECLQFGSWKICFIKCPIRRSGVASDLPNNLISVKDKHKTCLIEKIENVFMKICRLKITYVSISFHIQTRVQSRNFKSWIKSNIVKSIRTHKSFFLRRNWGWCDCWLKTQAYSIDNTQSPSIFFFSFLYTYIYCTLLYTSLNL